MISVDLQLGFHHTMSVRSIPYPVSSSKLLHSISLVVDLLLQVHLQGGSPTIVINLEVGPTMTIIPTATGQTFTGPSSTIAVVRLPLVTTAQDHRNLVSGTTPLDGSTSDLLRVHHRGTKIDVIP
jgi:hypothetical protein